MKQELENGLKECTEELNDIEKRLKKLSAFDKERNYLTKYALIKACGTAEYTYRSIVVDYFSQLDSRIDTYLKKKVRNSSGSAEYKNMKGLLGQFDAQWRKNFKDAVDARPNGQRLIDASNSLVKKQA